MIFLLWCNLLSSPVQELQNVPVDPVNGVEKFSFGSFEGAYRITSCPHGWLYVVERGSHSITLLKSHDAVPKRIGGFGWGQLSFDSPTSLSADGLNVYVSDYGNHRVQRFDKNLNYISTLSTRSLDDESGRFGYPAGVDLSKKGELFILDGENNRVVRFSQQSKFQAFFGDSEAKQRKIQKPIELTVTKSDRIFVLESLRVLEYDYFGSFIRTIGEGEIRNAKGFYVDDERLVVAEEHSVLWFDLNGVLSRRIDMKEFISSESLSSLVDVMLIGKDIYLLTEKKIHVFELR